MTESDKQGNSPETRYEQFFHKLNEETAMEPIYGLEMNYVRRYWFSCSLFVRQWSNPVQKLNRNHGLEIMICKNHFVSCNELIVTHHASKRTVYSKFKITIDFNYILMAKTAAFKFGEFLVFFFFICGVRREARAPLGQSCKNFLFFLIPATLRLDRSTSGSQNLPKVRALISCATQASNHCNQ